MISRITRKKKKEKSATKAVFHYLCKHNVQKKTEQVANNEQYFFVCHLCKLQM